MSHYRLKTKFKSEGSYGSEETHTLYAHHNLSCDYVTFFEEDGTVIMVVPDTIDNNILDAINRLYAPFENGGNDLSKDVETMDANDREKCGL